LPPPPKPPRLKPPPDGARNEREGALNDLPPPDGAWNEREGALNDLPPPNDGLSNERPALTDGLLNERPTLVSGLLKDLEGTPRDSPILDGRVNPRSGLTAPNPLLFVTPPRLKPCTVFESPSLVARPNVRLRPVALSPLQTVPESLPLLRTSRFTMDCAACLSVSLQR